MSGDRTDWRDRAACVGEEPELFFPIGTGARAAQQVAEAKSVCARCTVTARCVTFASDHGYLGVWGGLDENERRRLRAGRRRVVA